VDNLCTSFFIQWYRGMLHPFLTNYDVSSRFGILSNFKRKAFIGHNIVKEKYKED
jgi:hypothetical protein